jgi:penicillin-binding protein 1B
MYANEVYLGQRGSFAIHGFGEGATAQFGRDLSELTLPEAATLAGIIPAPNAYSPSKHPDRATVRRNLILRTMRQEGVISADNYEKAKQAGLEIIQLKAHSTDATYLVDFILEEVLKDYSETNWWTVVSASQFTLDSDFRKLWLGCRRGLAFVEEQLAARKERKSRKAIRSRRPD